MASMYAQKKLAEFWGIKSLSGEIYEDQSFHIIFPPCYCSLELNRCPIHDKKSKPIICKDDENSPFEKYVPLFEALSFLKLVENMKNPPPKNK